MQGHLKGVSDPGHFQGHAKGTGCCCQNYLRQGASPDRRSRVGRSSLKLKYFCCYSSCQLKSDRDSWLLSRSIWGKRGPAELCPPPQSTRSSEAHSLCSDILTLMKFQVQIWPLLHCSQTYHQASIFFPHPSASHAFRQCTILGRASECAIQ